MIPHTPGLKTRRRSNGATHFYWIASAKGYEPTTVRLHYPDTPEGRLEMASRCRVLQAAMLEWLGQIEPARPLAAQGTVAWIVDRYQTDEDSPYRDVRASTRKSYDESLAIIHRTVGARRIDAVNGPDVRRWFREWSRDGANLRRAYGCIQLLRIACAYGTSLRNTPCRDLRDVLSAMRFEAPKRRMERMTYAQSKAVREKAHELELPVIALATALQFELGLRQKDVIGEWVDGSGSGITDGPERAIKKPHRPRRPVQWINGLSWSHIDGQLVLRKPTSKSNGNMTAEHDLRRHPEVLAEIALVPPARRIGPVIIDPASGLPFRKRHFAELWRKVATAAGVPVTVWNMDARAGAISEAYEAGADPADVMKAATHSQIATSMRYNRGAVEQTGRVAELRQARRKS